jgi:hypothetical protein
METNELVKSLKQNKVTGKYFLGVYPADIAINQVYPNNKTWFIIVNTDRQDQPGQHWIVFFFTPRNSLDVFDPLGQAPYAYWNLIDFFNNSRFNITYNTRCLQSLRTNICGAHCLFYCFKKCQKKNKRTLSMYKIINKYYLNNQDYNDCMVLNFVINHFFNVKKPVNRMHKTAKKCKIKAYK